VHYIADAAVREAVNRRENAMLSDRARQILTFIQRFTAERGYPPTIREIGKAFQIASTNGVRYYLTILERAGHVKRSGRISRGIGPMGAAARRPGIPILGRVAAGAPILAEESFDGHLEPDQIFGDTESLFALRVRGDSMIDAGILEGDYVIVRKQDRASAGEIVVALLGEEATVKYYRPRAGHVELVPANEAYEPIVVGPQTERERGFRILGVVSGVIRTLRR
jgi:repressor LexA